MIFLHGLVVDQNVAQNFPIIYKFSDYVCFMTIFYLIQREIYLMKKTYRLKKFILSHNSASNKNLICRHKSNLII